MLLQNDVCEVVVRQNLVADRKEDRTRLRSGLLGVVLLGVPGNLDGQTAMLAVPRVPAHS